jgi:hypothetical protein
MYMQRMAIESVFKFCKDEHSAMKICRVFRQTISLIEMTMCCEIADLVKSKK